MNLRTVGGNSYTTTTHGDSYTAAADTDRTLSQKYAASANAKWIIDYSKKSTPNTSGNGRPLGARRIEDVNAADGWVTQTSAGDAQTRAPSPPLRMLSSS